MSKGGKRYFNKNKSGNWFIHTGYSQTGLKSDLCTSTGSAMTPTISQSLTQVEERYPKIFINPEKKSTKREYPLSVHDNRTALQHCIDVYEQGAGRKKCLDEHRQHNSCYNMWHHPHDTLSPLTTVNSLYQTDFMPKLETESREDTIRRRFPRDHSVRSQVNAAAQADDCFMWFGRDDAKQFTPLSVLAAANLSLTP